MPLRHTLLLRVDRDHRLVGFQEGGRLVCDVLELRVAVDVLLPFLGLAVRLQTIAQIVQKLATSVRDTLCPFLVSSFTRLRRLRVVHKRGDIGSPRVEAATRAFKSCCSVGSWSILRLRPAPGWRTRPEGAQRPERMSSIPRPIVDRASPLIRDIAHTPP